MTARIAHINGVTRLHTFEFSMDEMVWMGNFASGAAEASTLGFKPGQWPDNFLMRPFGLFTCYKVREDGTHEYRDESGHTFIILND